ncbi:MAG: hypothetical protein ABI591_26495 [Kofleriaceae bacterium]
MTGTSVEAITGHQNQLFPNHVPVLNGAGWATTVSTAGGIDFKNDFFQDLGKNGRRCVSCHLPTAGWGITPPQIQEIFNLTRGGQFNDGAGLGAIFRPVDGATNPNADVSTFEKRKTAYSMLLNKGLIRVGIGVPATAEFELIAVDDPYHYASATELSLFRRPLPATNLKFDTTVMWDGRENFAGQSIHFDLSDQANGATTGHAQGDPIDDATRESIVNFEVGLFFSQVYDFGAADLTASGAKGGPDASIAQTFHVGINDNFGDCIDPTCLVIGAPLGSGTRGAPFTPNVFDIYGAWTNTNSGNHMTATNRRAVARGEALFNTRAITITGVGGLNDEPAFGSPASLVGSCSTCHNTPNSGNHSVAAPLNIGLTDASRRTADMPLYTLRNKVTHEITQTTDPGRALISGKWAHIGRFKGPILRGLAARAPYFHNGFAADLDAVVDFYNDRFGMNLSAQEHSDLVAFLETL